MQAAITWLILTNSLRLAALKIGYERIIFAFQAQFLGSYHMGHVFQTVSRIPGRCLDATATLEGSVHNRLRSIVNRYDSFTTTFTIKNTYRTGQHYPVPSPPLGRGGTGHTKNPRALGGESSFCGAGAAIYSEKHLYSFVETVARRQLSSALPVSPLPIPPISHKKAFLQKICASVGMLFLP